MSAPRAADRRPAPRPCSRAPRARSSGAARPVSRPVRRGQRPQAIAAAARRVPQPGGARGRDQRVDRAPKRVALSRDALLASRRGLRGGARRRRSVAARPARPLHRGAQVLVRSIAAGTAPVSCRPATSTRSPSRTPAESLDARRCASRRSCPRSWAALVEAAEARRRASRARAVARFDAHPRRRPGDARRACSSAPPRSARASSRTYGSSETAGGCVYDGVPLGRVAVVDGELSSAGPSSRRATSATGRTAAAFVEHDGRRWYRTGDGGEIGRRAAVPGGRQRDHLRAARSCRLAAVEEAVRSLAAWDARLGEALAVPASTRDGGSGRSCSRPPSARSSRSACAASWPLAWATSAESAVVRGIDAMPTLPSGKPDRRLAGAGRRGSARLTRRPSATRSGHDEGPDVRHPAPRLSGGTSLRKTYFLKRPSLLAGLLARLPRPASLRLRRPCCRRRSASRRPPRPSPRASRRCSGPCHPHSCALLRSVDGTHTTLRPPASASPPPHGRTGGRRRGIPRRPGDGRMATAPPTPARRACSPG